MNGCSEPIKCGPRELLREQVAYEDLMQYGRRAVFVFVVLIAAAIALAPLIHTHPLSQVFQAPCAVCVGAVGRITPLALTAIAALVAVTFVAPFVVKSPHSHAYSPLASRAPPEA